MAVGNVDASLRLRWEIEDYLTLSYNLNIGDFVESPKFPADADGIIGGIGNNDIRWHMSLYPKGKSEEANNHSSLFLHANAEILAVATFIIYNYQGNKVVDYTLKPHIYGKTADDVWGMGKCFLLDFIENPASCVLRDDKLTIVCEIRNFKIINPTINNPQQRLHEYETLLDDNKFSDVALVSEGKTVRAHKCILAKRSPVFAAMLDTEIEENTLEIDDIKYDVLVEMIRFIYAGKVNNIDAVAGDLAVAADKYALDELERQCEKTLMRNLNTDNVICRLQLADKLSMDNLKKKAIGFMIASAVDISNRPEFDSLSRSIVREVFQSLANQNQ